MLAGGSPSQDRQHVEHDTRGMLGLAVLRREARSARCLLRCLCCVQTTLEAVVAVRLLDARCRLLGLPVPVEEGNEQRERRSCSEKQKCCSLQGQIHGGLVSEAGGNSGHTIAHCIRQVAHKHASRTHRCLACCTPSARMNRSKVLHTLDAGRNEQAGPEAGDAQVEVEGQHHRNGDADEPVVDQVALRRQHLPPAPAYHACQNCRPNQ